MNQHGHGLEERAPMVLRRVPSERIHLARAMGATAVEAVAGRWWEWVDAAADMHLPAAAVALTDVEPGGAVVVAALASDQNSGDDGYEELLQALLATFRRDGADSVVVRTTERRVVRTLLAAGFGPDPDVADRYVVAL